MWGISIPKTLTFRHFCLIFANSKVVMKLCAKKKYRMTLSAKTRPRKCLKWHSVRVKMWNFLWLMIKIVYYWSKCQFIVIDVLFGGSNVFWNGCGPEYNIEKDVEDNVDNFADMIPTSGRGQNVAFRIGPGIGGIIIGHLGFSPDTHWSLGSIVFIFLMLYFGFDIRNSRSGSHNTVVVSCIKVRFCRQKSHGSIKGVAILISTTTVNVMFKERYTYFFVHLETTCAKKVWNAIVMTKIFSDTRSHQSIIL